jgi:hypothetical protein
MVKILEILCFFVIFAAMRTEFPSCISYLKIYDYSKDEDSCHEVGQVRQVLSVEGFPQGADLVLSGGQQVEEGNDCAFELCAPTGIYGGGGEGFPDYRFANVGGDEERDARAEAIPLLKEFVQEQNNKSGNEKL